MKENIMKQEKGHGMESSPTAGINFPTFTGFISLPTHSSTFSLHTLPCKHINTHTHTCSLIPLTHRFHVSFTLRTSFLSSLPIHLSLSSLQSPTPPNPTPPIVSHLSSYLPADHQTSLSTPVHLFSPPFYTHPPTHRFTFTHTHPPSHPDLASLVSRTRTVV